MTLGVGWRDLVMCYEHCLLNMSKSQLATGVHNTLLELPVCHFKRMYIRDLLKDLLKKQLKSFLLLVSYCNDHHHHVVLLARISLTLSRHYSLSFIASGRSSGLHPVSSHSYCMFVQVGRPAFARPYVGVHYILISFILKIFNPFFC